MVNLLPEKKKKELKIEYFSRLLVLYLFFISIIILVSGLLLIPSYYLADVKEGIVKEEVSIYEDPVVVDEKNQISKELKSLNQKLEILSRVGGEVKVSNIFNDIVNHIESGVKINGMFYKENDVDSVSILVEGIADSRESLQNFVKGIESDEQVSEVSLPVSNLAKDKDIVFKIDIKGEFKI